MKKHVRKIPFYPIFILIKLAFKNGGVSFKSAHIFILYIIRYLLFEPFRLLEILIYQRKIISHELSIAPIFILGYWRSGTSHLQNLLQKDPLIATSTIYRSVFSDHYCSTEIWLKNPINFLCKLFRVKYAIQRTTMDLNLPAELDLALCSNSSEYSFTWGHLFPKRFENWFNDFILFGGNNNQAQWIEDYDFMIRKLSYASKVKRILVKSPGDMGRIHQLIEHYPNAKFIYIHRDPIAVFHSNQYLWKVIQQQNSIQKISEARIKQLIIHSYAKLLTNYLKNRDQISDSQLVEVQFKDLQQNPMDVMKQIYGKLDLGKLPIKEINVLISNNKEYKPKEYITPKALETELKSAWGFIYKTFPN